MDKQRRRNITIRLTENEVEELREIAEKEHRPVANMIYKIVSAFLKKNKDSE